MTSNISGSLFDDEKILEIRRKLKLLEDLIFATNIKTLNFEEEYKFLTNRKTFALVPIKTGTKCFVSFVDEKTAHIIINSNLFLINKKHLSFLNFKK